MIGNFQVGRNAVGLRCFDNLASHCQPGEVLYNQHCYRLHGKENPDDPGVKTEDASESCKKYGGKLVDITSQVSTTSKENRNEYCCICGIAKCFSFLISSMRMTSSPNG